MKKLSLLLVSIVLFSCSEVIDQAVDNAIPDPETLQIAVKNNSSETFTRIEVRTRSGYTHVFQQTQAGMYSGFQESNVSYSKTEVVIQTESGYYSFSPLSYNEETKVIKGRYYYDISILNNDTLSVIRKRF